MKKRSFFALLFCLVFFVTAVGCKQQTPPTTPSVSVAPSVSTVPSVSTTPADGNLIVNGTFSDSGEGIPEGWAGNDYGNPAAVYTADGALHVSVENGSVLFYTPVSLEEEATYTLSADVTVSSMSTGSNGSTFIGFALSEHRDETAVSPVNSAASLFYTPSVAVKNNLDFLAMTGCGSETFTSVLGGDYYLVFACKNASLSLTVDNVSLVKTEEEDSSEEIRILISSDMHDTPLPTWYGVSNDARLQQWVDGIIAEHEKQPIDALIILGDESLDYWEYPSCGYFLTTGVSYTKDFIDRFVSQLPKDFPVYYVPGNHEQYGNEQWLELTGQNRQGHFVIGDNLFIMSDTFGGGLNPTTHHGGVYSGVDMEYLINAVKDNIQAKNIWMFAHEFAFNKEGDVDFHHFMRSNKRIRGLFMGHTHLASLTSTPYQFLTIAQTGNFSYTQDKGSLEAMKKSFWGYRDLIISEHSAVSSYIIPETRAVLSGNTVTEIPYQKVYQITYRF